MLALKLVSQDTQRENLYLRLRFLPGVAISHDARKRGDLGDPAGIVLLLEMDYQAPYYSHRANDRIGPEHKFSSSCGEAFTFESRIRASNSATR